MSAQVPRDPTRPRGAVDEFFAGDYPDLRDDDARARDRKAVSVQARALRTAGREFFDRQVTRLVIERRRRPGAEPIAVVNRKEGGVPVIEGQLLVRTEIRDTAAWRTLQSLGFSGDTVAGLDDRLVVLNAPGLTADDLDDVARLVRSRGHQASVTHVTSLRPLAKGEGGPEPADVRSSFPPALLGAHQAVREVTVAVIDTGQTSDLRSDGWLSTPPAPEDVDPLTAISGSTLDFAAGHGTFAAGVVAQVAPMATVRPYRAMDSDGVGSEVDVACAMVQAARGGALVLNLSLGAETLDDQPLLAVEVALEILTEQHPDVLVVAAAGNNGSTRPCFPAASRQVVAVAALLDDGTPADWSTHGWWVDVSCVGQGVVSTYVVGEESPDLDPEPDTWVGPDPWAVWTGTSFAAPQISGAVARLCSMDGELTPRDALARLLANRHHLPDYGRAIRILPGT